MQTIATKNSSAMSSNAMSPASLLFTSPKVQQLTHFSKPYKNEAFVRLRNSTVSLVTLVLLTYLLPLPSLLTALKVVRGSDVVDAFWAICAAEIALSGLLALNLTQAAVAIQYPRSPPSSLPNLPDKKSLLTPQGQKKRRTILSSGTSPQTQRSFSSSYVASPVSTPSRTLHYSMPSTLSPFGVSSLGASTSSVPSTPSPSLAAYHGKHPPSLGRAFNGSTLSQLADDSDDDS